MKLRALKIAALFLAFTGNTYAASIVDTGLIGCNNTACQGASLNNSFNAEGMWAASFTLTSNTTITDMQVWLNNSRNTNTSFTMSIYADNFSLPDSTNEIFTQNTTVINKAFEDNFNNQWQGLSNLDINLTSGTYWLSIGLPVGSLYDGYLPTGEYGALNAVGDYAFFNLSNGEWLSDPGSDFAFKIDGTVSAVPLPAAVWLFGFGLMGLFGFARRKTPA